MDFTRLLIFLSLFCCSYAAKQTYIFCKDTNGTIMADLDAVIDIKDKNTTSKITNLQQQNTTAESCTSENKRMFRIDFEGGSSLKVIIENKSGTVFLEELQVTTKTTRADDFPSKELSKSDEYYMCKHPDAYKLSSSSSPDLEITVTFNEIKLQGFGVVDNSYSKEQAICAAPNSTTTSTTKTSTATSTKTPTTSTKAPTTTTKAPTTTTKAPTTTTKAPITTSTKAPTTSTKAPTTSTKVPTTTTKQTSTTTKKANTTTSPIMTTTKPYTTVSPSGKAVALDIKINGTTCLLVEFEGNLTFAYDTKKGKNTYTHVIDAKDVKRMEGNCMGNTPYVKGILSMNCAVEFVFSKTSKLQSPMRRLLATSFEYALTNVTVTYDTSKPSDAVKGSIRSEWAKPPHVTANSGEIYKCNSPQELLKEGNTMLRVKNFRAGAYSPNRNNVNTCPADNSSGNNVVPIVVGVILACLVVIIIVAYLIGRRRNREGYQSV